MKKRGYVITKEMVSKGKNKEKTSRWSKIKSNATILISLGALVISGWVGYSNNKRAQYLESTNFNIIKIFGKTLLALCYIMNLKNHLLPHLSHHILCIFLQNCTIF